MSIQEVPQISELSIFSALPEISQRFLQDRMHCVDYPAGAMIVRAGMHCDYMAIVACGAIELRAVSGEAQMIGQGGIFGQDMMRYAAPSAFSIRTVLPTTLWVIGRSDWLAASYAAREESRKQSRKVARAAPKSFASDLLNFRQISLQSPKVPEVVRNQAGQNKKPTFQISWKVMVAILVVALVLVVIGPTLLGWTDFTLVRLFLQVQKPNLAESYLSLALSWRPDSAVLQDALGYVRYLQVKPDQALEEFRRAVELQPDLASAQNNLGVVLLACGRASEALPHLQKAVDLDPGNATLLVNLGNAYLAIDNTTSAMTAYQDAFAMDPSQATAQAHWAILALKQGRVTEARKVLEKATATDPKLALAHQGLGVAALIEGQPATALPELEAARRLNPQDASINLYLGLALKELDRPMDAAIEFIRVLSLSQDPAYTSLARENLQQVYDHLIPGGPSSNKTLPGGLLQRGGSPATDH